MQVRQSGPTTTLCNTEADHVAKSSLRAMRPVDTGARLAWLRTGRRRSLLDESPMLEGWRDDGKIKSRAVAMHALRRGLLWTWRMAETAHQQSKAKHHGRREATSHLHWQLDKLGPGKGPWSNADAEKGGQQHPDCLPRLFHRLG